MNNIPSPYSQPVRISIIVPNYNYARFLLPRLKSISNQTYPIFQLIVLDDASTDHSLSVIRDFLNSTLISYRLVVNPENSGNTFHQWYEGLKYATGELIWIAESDDLCEPDFLANLVPLLEDPEVVLAYCESKQIDEEGNVTHTDYRYLNNRVGNYWDQDYVIPGEVEVVRALSFGNTIRNASACLFRRTALEVVLNSFRGELLQYKVAGDWFTYLHLAKMGKIAFNHKSLNSHRLHGKNITCTTKHHNEVDRVRGEVINRLNSTDTQILLLGRFAMAEQSKGNLKLAKTLFQRAIALNPKEAWPFIKYADALLEPEEIDEKIAVIQKALQVEPNNLWANLLSLEAWNQKSNLTERAFNFQKMFRKDLAENIGVLKKFESAVPKMIRYDEIVSFSQRYRNCLVFLSHDSSPYGASHYLFSLFSYMKSNGVKCCVLVDKHNPALYKKYNISEDEILSYRQSDFALREICELLNPKLIYVNSINNPLASFVNQTNLSHRILTHSHEVYEHYSHQIRKPDWVVSERIKQTYIDQNDYAPKVQPPIITEDVFNLIDDSVKIPVSVGNEFGPLDLSRLTIGMSGQTDSRKNPKLFLEVAKIYPRLNFIWIGGQKNFFESQTNLYHVPEVSVPYSYYLLFDYFMLFSLQDPCPYVVLENLYLNNKVITFKENIYYEHNSPLLEDLYFECAGSISLESVCRVIDSLVKEKATRGSKGGTRYIRENFSQFRPELLETLGA